MPGPKVQYSYPGEVPGWLPVPPSVLQSKPFLQICNILALADETPINMGTGWLCAPGVIATAAHVLLGANSCKIRWSSAQNAFQTADVELHPDFNPSRVASEVDLAKIMNVPGPTEPLQPLMGGSNQVMAAGFIDGQLVQHTGSAKPVGPYLGHNAHTDGGHSGGPLLVGQKVLALHLGTAAATSQHIPPRSRAQLNTLNSGIIIGSPSTQFLYS